MGNKYEKNENLYYRINKMKTYTKILLILAIIVISACQEISNEAERITVADIIDNKVSGFNWFSFEYSDYNINSELVEQISEKYQQELYKFIIFTTPTCSCGKEYRKFPQFVKILDSSNVSKDNYEIYSVGDINFSHPYENVFTLKAIPAFMILKNGVAIYSVNDTLLKYSSLSLEEALLQGLK